MSNKTRAVVALGGNALEDKSLPPTAESQMKVTKRTARRLAALSAAGYELALVHGNGPQVGRILLASETAADVTPPMPFDVCSAMSQGYIGYQLQQQMRQAAAELDFETAAKLRDELFSLTGESVGVAKPAPGTIGSARRSKGRGRKSPKRK